MPVSELGARFDALLSAARAGDADAFSQLWLAVHPALLRYLRVVAGDAAEDVASEAWLKAITALGTFRGDEQGFRGWMVTIARNHLNDLRRRAVRRPKTLSPDLPGSALAPDPADIALERLGTAEALRLVATLPADQAEMVALRVVVGLDVPEVARIVGRSPGAVRVAVHRGLRRLAARLDAAGSVTHGEAEALSRGDV